MPKLSPKMMLAIALLLSFLIAGLTYTYLQGIATQANKPTSTVIVAKVDIPLNTKITAEMVEAAMVPNDYIQPGALTSLDKVVGIVTREQIVAGEQINQRLLVTGEKELGFTAIIPRDKRAVTINVSDVIAVAGFIKPGDYVDVVMTYDKSDVGSHTSRVVLQNIQVLAVNSRTDGKAAPDITKDPKEAAKLMTMTLAVSPDQAAEVTLADEKGKIRLALRPYQPSDGFVITTATTPQDLVGMHPTAQQDNSAAPNVAPPPVAAPAPMPSYKPSGEIQTIRGTKVETVTVN